jgi:DnaJ-class molecular chaperone
MAIKDYYLILGVSRDESPEGIRAAFRQLAKRYHPDRAGAESTAEFQQIVEAYEVLSDPARRAQHNRHLAAEEAGERARAGEALSRSEREREFRRFAARLAGYGPAMGLERRSPAPPPWRRHESVRQFESGELDLMLELLLRLLR